MITTMTKSAQIINKLIDEHRSAREFSRAIKEDISDVVKWRKEKLRVSVRAVVTLAELFNINPHDLRPEIFPERLKFVFNKDMK